MGATRIAALAGLVTAAASAAGAGRWRTAEQPADWRKPFAEAALQIPFDSSRTPERDSGLRADLAIPAGLLRMRVAVPRTSDSGRMSRIALRITSDTAYPSLGIAPGANYVWKDFANAKMRLLMIPADPRTPPRWLVIGVQAHSHYATVRAPRLVFTMRPPTSGRTKTKRLAMDICIDGCSTDPMAWCRTRDTTFHLNVGVVKMPAAVTAYFARNHVSWAQR